MVLDRLPRVSADNFGLFDDVEEAVERSAFQLPRMADFAEFVEGAAELLGLEMGNSQL